MQFERVGEGRYRCGDSLVVVAEQRQGRARSAAVARAGLPLHDGAGVGLRRRIRRHPGARRHLGRRAARAGRHRALRLRLRSRRQSHRDQPAGQLTDRRSFILIRASRSRCRLEENCFLPAPCARRSARRARPSAPRGVSSGLGGLGRCCASWRSDGLRGGCVRLRAQQLRRRAALLGLARSLGLALGALGLSRSLFLGVAALDLALLAHLGRRRCALAGGATNSGSFVGSFWRALSSSACRALAWVSRRSVNVSPLFFNVVLCPTIRPPERRPASWRACGPRD